MGKERIFLKIFGKVEPTIKTVDTVQLKNIFTPFICSDNLSQNVHSQHEHLQNLTLVDSSPDGNKRIDILVGVDYYYSCIGSEIKRGSENQPPAISSFFGWILSSCDEPQRNVHTNLNSTHVLRCGGADRFEKIGRFGSN